MTPATILIFDTPFERAVPGLIAGRGMGAFPFWGHYSILDVLLAGLTGGSDNDQISVITSESNRDPILPLVRRWNDLNVRLATSPSDSGDLHHLLPRRGHGLTLVSSTGYLAWLDRAMLEHLWGEYTADPLRIRIEGNDTDLYVMTRERATTLFHTVRAQTFDEAVAQLFRTVLPDAAERRVPLSTPMLFHSSLGQLVEAHRRLLGGPLPGPTAAIERLESLPPGLDTARIGRQGSVRSSILSPGCRIDGDVRNCIIFPGCHVDGGARVVDSIIMSHNRVGAESEIANTVLLPSDADHGHSAPNVGAGCRIGNQRSIVQNERWPEQIKGITVVGMNADLPGDLEIGSGALIDANVSHRELQGVRKVVAGSTVTSRGTVDTRSGTSRT